MLFQRIYEEGLSQASYFIGCQKHGIAAVVDPRRDIQVYRDLAEENGMEIVAVTETHIHADYLSGTRELAAATGATLYVSGEGGQDWQYGFDGTRLTHGDTVELGNITLTALHTPGHTPEHLSFLVTDGAVTDQPGYLLSGDFVFVGDLGRPDLLDEAAGGQDTRYEGAKQLFQSLRDVFLTLEDYVQVHPAHGAGSPCGKALGAVPSSTVGYERRFAWWGPYLENDDEEGFVRELLEGQPDAHAYFARMKRENRDGPAVLGELPELPRRTAPELAEAVETGDVVVVDTRSPERVHDGTVKDSVAVPAGPKASNFAAWVIDPVQEKRPLVVLAPDAEAAAEFRDTLLRTGIDTVRAYTDTLDGLPMTVPEQISPRELQNASGITLVDVRGKSEYAQEHIPGAQQLSGGAALWRLDELPQDTTLVTYCQSGTRNTVVASGLRRAGYRVMELEGSFEGWKRFSEN
ncbi:rhodanese-like domain-containing protein [Kocuria rhizophila]|uniref:rhodanese-like domain-containing protein n=1 Tax=Kocuria rhizophila TaxID=72000 RepID=UPI0038798ABD